MITQLPNAQMVNISLAVVVPVTEPVLHVQALLPALVPMQSGLVMVDPLVLALLVNGDAMLVMARILPALAVSVLHVEQLQIVSL